MSAETPTPPDERTEALDKLEDSLRVLAQGATALADLLAGKINDFDVLNRPGHPGAPSKVAYLIEADLTARYAKTQQALQEFREAVAPGALQIVEPED